MSLFTEEAWKNNLKRYEKILNMPFNKELAAGILPQKAFKHYLIQDMHYLESFARVLAIAAAKGKTTDHIIQFASYVNTALVVESLLHQNCFEKFGVGRQELTATELSPACELYTSYLIKLAYQVPYEVLIAGVLPCFWIYSEVGKHIYKQSVADNQYQEWIDTYASEEFEVSVRKVINVANNVAAQTTDAIRKEMHHAFSRATQLEWIFWDSAYHQHTWPL